MQRSGCSRCTPHTAGRGCGVRAFPSLVSAGFDTHYQGVSVIYPQGNSSPLTIKREKSNKIRVHFINMYC